MHCSPDDAQSNCRVALLPLVPLRLSQLFQTLPLHDWLLPLHAVGALPPLRQARAASQFAPAAAMQLTCEALTLAAAAVAGSLTCSMVKVHWLMPPAMMPQADAVAQAASPLLPLTPEPQPASAHEPENEQ